MSSGRRSARLIWLIIGMSFRQVNILPGIHRQTVVLPLQFTGPQGSLQMGRRKQTCCSYAAGLESDGFRVGDSNCMALDALLRGAGRDMISFMRGKTRFPCMSAVLMTVRKAQ